MNNIYKVKAKYISVPLVLLVLVVFNTVSGKFTGPEKSFFNQCTLDTIPVISKPDKIKDSADKAVKVNDSIKISKIKTDTFYVKMSKDSLDAPVIYHADDSMVYDVPGKRILLYGKKTEAKYKDNDLTAPGIEFDQQTNLITASMRKDSTGKLIDYPTFVQNDFKSISDTIRFNMKTGKGLTKGTYTKQGEMFVYGEKIKKINEKVFFAKNGRFTTCSLDTPHFSFVSKKIKFINKKMAITGPVHPEIEGIPLPIYFPFGIYPLSQGRHSGILAPTFTANAQRGLALEGMGYYKVISDYWDVAVRATLYSYGSWTADITPRYMKKYHYSGSFRFDYQKFKDNFKGDPDYSSGKTFNIQWSHSMDSKARPGVSFSANVNAGSSKFNSYVPNNTMRNVQNSMQSSIQFAKIWKNKPYNVSVNANHNQNTNTKIINVTLPDVAFNLNTQYPFRRKDPVGSLKWYENIGFALNSNVRSTTHFSDDSTVNNQPIGKQISKNLQWGGNHSVPITLSLPQIGPLQISPGVSYTEHWYQQKLHKSWNDTDKKLDSVYQNGFYTARDMSFSIGVSTRIFGMFGFNKKSKVQAIRHEIRPSISVSYKPNMNSRSFYSTKIDSAGSIGRYSVYEGNMFGGFSEGKFGGMGFSIDNNLQMKVKNKKDTAAGAMKKVTLLDGFSLNGSYNFLVDSFQLSTFSLSARSNLFDKINITASASLDPYDVDSAGRRVKQLLWKRKPVSFGRLTTASISLSSQFQGGKDKNNKKKQQTALMGQPYNTATGMPLDEYQTELAYMNSNPAEFVDFSIPWSANVAYSLRLVRDGVRSTISSNQDFNMSGSLSLTPKWQLSASGFYNITEKSMGPMTFSISREMHCWQMSINVSPIGTYRYFNISISPKSGLLRDLKINRTRSYYDQ